MFGIIAVFPQVDDAFAKLNCLRLAGHAVHLEQLRIILCCIRTAGMDFKDEFQFVIRLKFGLIAACVELARVHINRQCTICVCLAGKKRIARLIDLFAAIQREFRIIAVHIIAVYACFERDFLICIRSTLFVLEEQFCLRNLAQLHIVLRIQLQLGRVAFTGYQRACREGADIGCIPHNRLTGDRTCDAGRLVDGRRAARIGGPGNGLARAVCVFQFDRSSRRKLEQVQLILQRVDLHGQLIVQDIRQPVLCSDLCCTVRQAGKHKYCPGAVCLVVEQADILIQRPLPVIDCRCAVVRRTPLDLVADIAPRHLGIERDGICQRDIPVQRKDIVLRHLADALSCAIHWIVRIVHHQTAIGLRAVDVDLERIVVIIVENDRVIAPGALRRVANAHLNRVAFAHTTAAQCIKLQVITAACRTGLGTGCGYPAVVVCHDQLKSTVIYVVKVLQRPVQINAACARRLGIIQRIRTLQRYDCRTRYNRNQCIAGIFGYIITRFIEFCR